MNKFGTREEISISGSVFVFSGVQQNAVSSFINKSARLNERGLMRGSFASQPDEGTGRVQRYATEGTWKQRFLHIEFDVEGFSLSLYRPQYDRLAVTGLGSAASSPLVGSPAYLPDSPSSSFSSKGKKGEKRNKESRLNSPLNDTRNSPIKKGFGPSAASTASSSSFFSSSPRKGSTKNDASFSNQLRQLTAELDLGDPEHEHIVENRLFREQIKEKKAVERTRFVLPEGIIKLRKVYLAPRSSSTNSATSSSVIDGRESGEKVELFLLRQRNGFTGEYKTVDHEFVVQLYMDGGFLEFIGRTDHNSHLWYQRLQSVIAIHNAYARVKKMLLNRSSFPVLPGRDEFPIARLVKIEDGTAQSSTFAASSSMSFSGRVSEMSEINLLKKSATYSDEFFGQSPTAADGGNGGSSRNLIPHASSRSDKRRQRFVLQMVLCKISLVHSKKGFDLTIVGKAVSGQQLFWRMCLDDVPVIHETDQYATIYAVPLTQVDMENISLGTEPGDEAFLLRREPEMLRILRGGEAAERVGKGTGGLFYLNKWANFLSVFCRLYSASHPTTFQKWGEGEVLGQEWDEEVEKGKITGGAEGKETKRNNSNNNNNNDNNGDDTNTSTARKKPAANINSMEYLLEEEARLNASFRAEEEEHQQQLEDQNASATNRIRTKGQFERPPLATSTTSSTSSKKRREDGTIAAEGEREERNSSLRPSSSSSSPLIILDSKDSTSRTIDDKAFGEFVESRRFSATLSNEEEKHNKDKEEGNGDDEGPPLRHPGSLRNRGRNTTNRHGTEGGGGGTAPPTPHEGRSRSNSLERETEAESGARQLDGQQRSGRPRSGGVRRAENATSIGDFGDHYSSGNSSRSNSANPTSTKNDHRLDGGHGHKHPHSTSTSRSSDNVPRGSVVPTPQLQQTSSGSTTKYYSPTPVPGASTIPGLADLSATLVRRINSFKNLKEVAHESVGLSEEDARAQAALGLGAKQRELSVRAAGEGRNVMRFADHEGSERARLDAIAVQYASSYNQSHGGGRGSSNSSNHSGDYGGGRAEDDTSYVLNAADGSSFLNTTNTRARTRQRSYSTAVGGLNRRSDDPAERLAARLHERGVANVTVESQPVSSPAAKEATLRKPTERSYFQVDERALIDSIPLLFLEGRHEDAMFSIMGFWKKYPPLVPPEE